MTNIVDVNTFDDVPLIEVGDEVKGGVDGPANKQAAALANRTKFLKEQQDGVKQRITDLKPTDIGAAPKTHQHVALDITDFNDATINIASGMIQPGTGITLKFDSNAKKLIISAQGATPTEQLTGYHTETQNGAIAGQEFVYVIPQQTNFQLSAYALKEEAGSKNVSTTLDAFSASSKSNYNRAPSSVFDGSLHNYLNETLSLASGTNSFYTADLGGEGDLQLSTMQLLGEVASSAFITGEALATLAGVKSGSAINSDTPWLKFYCNGKTLYIPKKPIRNSTTLADMTAAHKVPVTVGGKTYTLRLMTGAAREGITIPNSPNAGITSDPLTTGSEWDDLLLNCMNGKFANYSTTDVAMAANGIAAACFVAEKTDKGLWLHRGLTAKGAISDTYNATPSVNWGWRPVLEIDGLDGTGTLDKFVIQDKNGAYYSAVNGTLSAVTVNVASDVATVGTAFSGVLKASDLTALLPIKVFSNKALLVKSVGKSNSSLLFTKTLMPAANYAKINSLAITAKKVNQGNVMLAFTRDNTHWFAFTNGAWNAVTLTGTDTAADTAALLANGMTPEAVTNLTAANWLAFYDQNQGQPDYLGYALLLNSPSLKGDYVEVNSLVINIDNKSSWKKQTAAEVEIRWRENTVSFRPQTAGNFKLSYQF